MAQTPKILLVDIWKDDSEYDQVKRMLESFMPHVDGLCVAITGTSGKFDKLIHLVKKYGGKYITTNPVSHPNIYSKVGDKTIFSNFAAAVS